MNPVHTVLLYFLTLHFNIISTIYIEVSRLAHTLQIIPHSFDLGDPFAMLWNVKISVLWASWSWNTQADYFTAWWLPFLETILYKYMYIYIYQHWNYIKRRIQEGECGKEAKKYISVLMWLSQTLHARTHFRSKSERRKKKKKKIQKPGCKISWLGCCWCGWGWGFRVEGEIQKADVSFWRQ